MPTLKQLLFFSSLSSTVFAQQKCNGWSEFCSKSLKEIALPFSHNAYAYPNASAASIPPTANQDRGWTLDQQLKDGIRAMELDLLFRNQSSGSPQLWLCHDTCDGIIGFAGPSLSSAAASISTFLSAENPNEVLVLLFENVAKAKVADVASVLLSLQQYAYVPTSSSAQWPPLSQMISQNKRLVITIDTGYDPAVSWILDGSVWSTQTQFAVFTSSGFNCDPIITGSSPNALLRLNHMLSNSISQTIYYPDLTQISTINSESSITAHISVCKGANRQANLISVDFGRTGDLFKAVAIYNGVAPPASLSPLPGVSKTTTGQNSGSSKAVAMLLALIIVFLIC